MEALRYFPNGDDKLALVNLDNVNTDAEFIIKTQDEVVIQVYNAGLCGTDIHIVQVKLLIKHLSWAFSINEVWYSNYNLLFVIVKFKGEFKTSTTSPITLGHEFSGKIVALGDLAKEHFMIGDKVAVDPNRYIS